jgi:hypothetical protein
MKKALMILGFLLSLSILLNIFQYRNAYVKCENIDKQRKANLLYHLWHRSLDWDKDWIPCENLIP